MNQCLEIEQSQSPVAEDAKSEDGLDLVSRKAVALRVESFGRKTVLVEAGCYESSCPNEDRSEGVPRFPRVHHTACRTSEREIHV